MASDTCRPHVPASYHQGWPTAMSLRHLLVGLVALGFGNLLLAQAPRDPQAVPNYPPAYNPANNNGGNVPPSNYGQRPLNAAPGTAGAPQNPGVGNPAAGQGQLPPAAQQQPRAPFNLTQPEQLQVDSALLVWQSKQIKQFQASFTRWEYDPQFGPRDKQFLNVEAKGSIRYQAPDKGHYKVEETKVYNAQKQQYIADPNRVEEWSCDGKSIFEFDYKNKQLVEHVLPPQLQGKSIVEAPLPFVFGANAEQLKQRYWIRLTTPADDNTFTWLEAFPRRREDAANYQKVEIILVNATMIPDAIQMHLPGGTLRQVYKFVPQKDAGLRGFFGGFDFKPSTPFGWKFVKDDPGAQQVPPQNAGKSAAPTDPRNATQPGTRPLLR